MSEFDDGMTCVHGVASCDPCLERHSAQVRTLERQLAEAQAQVGAMREFARHDGACQTISGIPGEPDATKRGPCTCGLNAALAPEAGRNYRASILEEAAEVADRLQRRCAPECADIAARIRALKETP